MKEWNWDLTTRKAKEKYSHLVDFDYQQKVEQQVTEYIQNNFFFVVFSVDEKESRIQFESRIISTVSNCSGCKPSSNWLGLFSPKPKIRESGLWLENELYKASLTEAELFQLKEYIKSDNRISRGFPPPALHTTPASGSAPGGSQSTSASRRTIISETSQDASLGRAIQ